MKLSVSSRIEATAYRATTYDTPLWVSPNRRAGRWNRPGDHSVVQYCCLDPAAPLAEVVRHEDLDVEEATQVRFGLWELRISEGSVVNLSTPQLADRAGIDWMDLISDDWTACQNICDRAREAGARGIVAPSAALPGSFNLMLLGARSGQVARSGVTVPVPVDFCRAAIGAPDSSVDRRSHR